MTNLYHEIRQVLNGSSTINNRIKYMIICMGIAVIHLVCAIAFYMCWIQPLFLYNIAITLFYFYHGFYSVRRQHYLFVYFTSLLEIMFFVACASLMLGWEWGFAMYTIALIPVGFYLTYTLPQLERQMSFPVISSVVMGVWFTIVRFVSEQVAPLYEGDIPVDIQTIMYYFNILITFVVIILFSTLFALEIRYMQRRLEQENRKLGAIANYDPLTNLLNRRSMNIQLRVAMEAVSRNNEPFCVMLVDIDDFKLVNDTYGHDCGDEVLIAVAERICSGVREEDAVCRWGGEEILVLVKSDLQGTKLVAERICQDIKEMVVHYKESDVKVTVTIGLSSYRENQTVRTMIEEADRNLYYGKNNGKMQVVC